MKKSVTGLGIAGGVLGIIFSVMLLISSLVFFFISVYTEFPNENNEQYVDTQAQGQGIVVVVLAVGCFIGAVLSLVASSLVSTNAKRSGILMSVGAALTAAAVITCIIYIFVNSIGIIFILVLPGLVGAVLISVGAAKALAKDRQSDQDTSWFKKIDDQDVSRLEKIADREE